MIVPEGGRGRAVSRALSVSLVRESPIRHDTAAVPSAPLPNAAQNARREMGAFPAGLLGDMGTTVYRYGRPPQETVTGRGLPDARRQTDGFNGGLQRRSSPAGLSQRRLLLPGLRVEADPGALNGQQARCASQTVVSAAAPHARQVPVVRALSPVS